MLRPRTMKFGMGRTHVRWCEACFYRSAASKMSYSRYADGLINFTAQCFLPRRVSGGLSHSRNVLNWLKISIFSWPSSHISVVFRLDALAFSVIATATWLAGWVGGCLCLSQPVLYQND